jgi:hypothetical protein
MSNFTPISREALLIKGKCCFDERDGHSRCYHCPYWVKPQPPVFEGDRRILDALLSGETVTIESDRFSLVSEVVLQNRVTIRYKVYQNATI